MPRVSKTYDVVFDLTPEDSTSLSRSTQSAVLGRARADDTCWFRPDYSCVVAKGLPEVCSTASGAVRRRIRGRLADV
jgi:hypothetical protein